MTTPSRHTAFGVLMLVLAVVYYNSASAIPQSGLADAVGPQGLPRIYAAALAALALVRIARSRQPAAVSGVPAAGGGRPSTDVLRSLGLLTIGVGYVLIVPWAGYIAAIALLIGTTIGYQARAWRRTDAMIAVAGALFLWILFVLFLGIRQPGGIWSALQ
jgi:putative tricarboxylic transport membrane protein